MNPSCLEIFSLLDSLEHVLALFFALKRNFPRFSHRKPIPRTAGIPFQGPSNQRAGSPCQSCSAPASRTDRLPVGVRSPAPIADPFSAGSTKYSAPISAYSPVFSLRDVGRKFPLPMSGIRQTTAASPVSNAREEERTGQTDRVARRRL